MIANILILLYLRSAHKFERSVRLPKSPSCAIERRLPFGLVARSVPEAERWSERGRMEWGGLELGQRASRRRQELLRLLDELDPKLWEFDEAVELEMRIMVRGAALRMDG